MAWTDVPDFTVGQVLTSSRMNQMRNNDNIGHRICTSTTRPASPDTGTMIYESDTLRTLIYSGTAWVAPQLPQVLSVNYDTEFSTTGQSLSDTGLNLNITPLSINSRILVIATTPIRVDNSPNTIYYEAAGVVTLRRGATNLQSHGVGLSGGYEGGYKSFVSLSSFMYLDSPATTSVVNYKTMIKSSSSVFRIYSNNQAVYGGNDLELKRSQMILIEIF